VFTKPCKVSVVLYQISESCTILFRITSTLRCKRSRGADFVSMTWKSSNIMFIYGCLVSVVCKRCWLYVPQGVPVNCNVWWQGSFKARQWWHDPGLSQCFQLVHNSFHVVGTIHQWGCVRLCHHGGQVGRRIRCFGGVTGYVLTAAREDGEVFARATSNALLLCPDTFTGFCLSLALCIQTELKLTILKIHCPCTIHFLHSCMSTFLSWSYCQFEEWSGRCTFWSRVGETPLIIAVPEESIGSAFWIASALCCVHLYNCDILFSSGDSR
jgi:hypothetical protein